MKKLVIILAVFVGFTFVSCEIDNYDEPEVILSGTVTYNGDAVGVRANATELELWQDGYALDEKINVYIAQDGTYSARLFNGEYKMVRLAGAPWDAQSSDTIVVNVSGNTVQNVEVQPYYTVHDATIQQVGNTVQAQFVVDQVDTDAALSKVKLYLSKSILVDENEKSLAVSADISTVVSGETATITAPLTEELLQAGYLFARVGVLSDQSSEYYYTQVQKLEIDGDVPINPTASFTAAVSGSAVTFTNTSTHGVSYAWDFGDGETSAEQSPAHTYATDGEFTVTLTVTGEEGTTEAVASQTIAVGYSEITVANGDMSLPGTGRLQDWADVPGWSSDATTTDSGVEAAGWYMPSDDNDYAGMLYTADGSAYNQTDYVLTEGETIKLTLKGIEAYNGPTIVATLYYNTGNGTRTVITTESFTVVSGSWTSLEMIATVPAAATGAKLGVELLNQSSNGADGWTSFDDVQLFVK